MKEHPILMSTDMVKAILDGKKTQTRRVVTSQTSIVGVGLVDWSEFDWEQKTEYDFGDSRYSKESEFIPDELKGQLIGVKKAPAVRVDGDVSEYHYQYLHVPYRWGEDATVFRIYPKWDVGDRLVIKETWAADRIYDNLKPSDIPEAAKIYYIDKNIRKSGGYSLFPEIGKTRSAMFMCLWMSRTRPVITEVRVERLNQMTEADVKAEGIPSFTLAKGVLANEPPDPRWKFIELWGSLNAKRGYGWDLNPWVWILSFKKVEGVMPIRNKTG